MAKAVPWRDWGEWKEVYFNVMSGTTEGFNSALISISDWQHRSRLPISIEATAYILANLANNSEDSSYGQNPHASIYSCSDSLSIVRFVNLLTDLVQKGFYAASVENLASSIGIPSWIVHLRHTACHGATVPRKALIRKALRFLLHDFIIPKYWQIQALEIQDLEGSTTLTDVVWNLQHVIDWCESLCHGVISFRKSKPINMDGTAIYWINKCLRNYIIDRCDVGTYHRILTALFGEVASSSCKINLIRIAIRSNNIELVKVGCSIEGLREIVPHIFIQEIGTNLVPLNTSIMEAVFPGNTKASNIYDSHLPVHSQAYCAGTHFNYDSLLDL